MPRYTRPIPSRGHHQEVSKKIEEADKAKREIRVSEKKREVTRKGDNERKSRKGVRHTKEMVR